MLRIQLGAELSNLFGIAAEAAVSAPSMSAPGCMNAGSGLLYHLELGQLSVCQMERMNSCMRCTLSQMGCSYPVEALEMATAPLQQDYVMHGLCSLDQQGVQATETP